MNTVYIVGAGPGDPDLITVKGMDLVKRADILIYAGSLVEPELVSCSDANIKLNSWGMQLEEILDAIETGVKAGKLVVRLHSGDPSLYGAIVEQIAELEKRGILVEIIPGVSSLFSAAAALQTQLTLKGVADTLIITRPAGKTLKRDDIRELSRFGATMALFLGTEKIEDIISYVTYPPETPVAVVYHASWKDELIIKGTVADIVGKVRKAGVEKSALIIIGRVVDPKTSGYMRSVLYS
ncbi:MAG: cobalt-precorrin-4/precorrin-4 C(11)-methyltransferase [Methanomicrobiales archaeon]|nr:cobalt-precorrin-4/precorrin-4 C(11)-methyltransferase [Methanomicrobiales archaeon]